MVKRLDRIDLNIIKILGLITLHIELVAVPQLNAFGRRVAEH